MSEEINPNYTGTFTRASMLLRKKKLTADEANELTELLKNMASANIIAQFGAKLDNMNATLNAKLDGQLGALEAKLDAKLDGQSAALDAKLDGQSAALDAMNTKYNVLIWAIGFATAILSAAIFFT